MTAETARLAGAQAPDIELFRPDLTSVRLGQLWAQGPVALVFLPPIGDPRCEETLFQWRDATAPMGQAGGTIVAVCPGNPAAVGTLPERWGLAYTVLADPDAKAFGAFAVSRELPGSFVIDTAGTIRFVHRNETPFGNAPTWDLIETVAGITGHAVERPAPIALDGETDGEADDFMVPRPGVASELKFTCAKCANSLCEVLDVATASGMLSRMFNFQNRRFSAVVCTRCQYTEFYRTQAGMLRNIFDLLAGG
jgi:hypothetical protein